MADEAVESALLSRRLSLSAFCAPRRRSDAPSHYCTAGAPGRKRCCIYSNLISFTVASVVGMALFCGEGIEQQTMVEVAAWLKPAWLKPAPQTTGQWINIQ